MATRSPVPASIEVIQRSIDTIEERLDQAISLEALARDAGISFWHFVRVFRATVGETPKDYIRRRRLTRAACALLETARSVLDIALEAGFESNEAFTRAFRAQFDSAPRDFRSAGVAPVFPRAKPEITHDYLEHLQHGISRVPQIVRHTNIRLVGVKLEFAVAPERFDLLALGAPIWNQFIAGLDELGGRIDRQTCFVCELSASGPEQLRGSLMPCAEVSDFGAVPEGWFAEVRPASRDAVFLHRGRGRAWEYTLHYLFDTWRQEAGESITDLPLFYRFDPARSPFSAEPELELWLGLSELQC